MLGKRYRIVSDGTPMGTKVLDPDGRPLDMGLVTKVEWSVEAGGIGVARVTFWNVEAELTGEEVRDFSSCPATSEQIHPG